MGSILNERKCSLMSKFFPLIVDTILEPFNLGWHTGILGSGLKEFAPSEAIFFSLKSRPPFFEKYCCLVKLTGLHNRCFPLYIRLNRTSQPTLLLRNMQTVVIKLEISSDYNIIYHKQSFSAHSHSLSPFHPFDMSKYC